MTTHLDWWWNGIKQGNYQWYRAKYPLPHISTEDRQGSMSYTGKVTAIGNDPEHNTTIRIIDNTVVYRDVDENVRTRALDFFKAQQTFNFAMGFGFLGLGGMSYWTQDERKASRIMANGGGLIAVVGFVFTVIRGLQTSEEAQAWEDTQFSTICQERRRCGEGIDYVCSRNYRGRLVTDREVVDIWQKSINSLIADKEAAFKQGGPAVDRFFNRFFSDYNPFNPHIIRYVFNNNAMITDPRNPATVFHKAQMTNQCNTFTSLWEFYRVDTVHFKNNIDKIHENATMASEKVTAHSQAAAKKAKTAKKDCIKQKERERKIALEPYEQHLRARLNASQANDPQNYHQHSAQILQEHYNLPNVVSIEEEFARAVEDCESRATLVIETAEALYKGPSLTEIEKSKAMKIKAAQDDYRLYLENQYGFAINNVLSPSGKI